ncbi:MAG: hypothetical protein ACYTGZ_00010 [Planctomycetota bacterium]|jgi:hypothetical protein
MSKGWLRRILRWLGLALAALAVTWPLATSCYRRGFEAEVQSLRESGVLVDLAAFNRAAIPERENAAVVLREGLEWCKECGLDLELVTVRWEVADRRVRDRIAAGDAPSQELTRERDEAWGRVERVISKLRPWYVRIERAGAMTECWFDVDHAKMLNPDPEPYRTTRAVAESLEWRVRARVRREGSVPQSIRDCESLLRWGRHIEPVFAMRYSTYRTVHAIACGMVQRVSAQPGFVPGFARQRLESLLLAAEREDERLRATVDSAFAGSIAATRLWATWEGSRELTKVRAAIAAIAANEAEQALHAQPDYGLMVRAAIARPLIWRSGARAFAVWNEGVEILFRDDTESLADLDVLIAEHRAEHDPMTSGYQTLRGLHRIRLQLRAHLRVTRVGLAALEHRRREGRWPASAADLAPLFVRGTAGDPFTREPFAFVRVGDSLLVEAAVPWLDDYDGEERENRRIYWELTSRN